MYAGIWLFIDNTDIWIVVTLEECSKVLLWNNGTDFYLVEPLGCKSPAESNRKCMGLRETICMADHQS